MSDIILIQKRPSNDVTSATLVNVANLLPPLGTHNLGQNKMEQQTPTPPPPPKSRMKPREGQKRAIFPSLIWGGSRFSIYFVQDCSLRTADEFTVVASLGGRGGTTGNTSAVRRLLGPWLGTKL